MFDIKTNQIKNFLSSWIVSTGQYLSGNSKGKPRIPDRLKPNSMCLLTECNKNVDESQRRIVGAFMVEENFLGNYCIDGIIQAHPNYRLFIPLENRPFFWSYINLESPVKQHWGNIPFKYMSNRIAERILFDLKTICCEEGQNELEKFYQYFCRMNNLRPRNEIANTNTDW